MKYFNPSYWFKMWVLSAPLFNSKSEGIHAKSIDNQNIKDWASKNTTNISFLENQEITLSNNQTSLLNLLLWNTNLTTHNQYHKHRHEKSRNRYKRRPIPPSKEIFQLSEKLIINQNNPNQYRSSFQSILESLTNNNIFRIIFDDSENRNWGENSRIFALNAQNFGYFRLPIEIRGEQDGQSYARNLELVLRTDNLYVQGFIITERQREIDINYYYHFDFTNININMQPRNVQNGLVPLLTRIENFENIQLTGIRPDYVDLLPTNINNINWQSIFNSFLTLTNGIDISQERPLGSLAQALGQVIFATAEAMRFPDIYARIVTHLIQRDENINLQRNQRNDIYRILVSWGTNSRNSIFRWLLQIANTIQNTPNMMISPPSIVDFTRELNLPAVQVVLGYIEFQRIRNIGRNANCRRGKRNITNKFWHEKFCDLKHQIDKIQGKITAIKVLDENTKGGNLKAGDIYVETTESFYLIHDNGKVDKFFPEKTLHWRDDKEIFELKNNWWNWEKKYWTKNFKMGWIDPKNYNRIEFLGDTSGSRISWGGTAYYADKFNKLEKADLSYYIKENEGICDKNNYWGLKVWFKVQELKEWWESAWIEGEQTFVFCSYKENDDYYLKIVIVQVATCHASSIGGSLFLELGRGVRLYNDDNKLETQISNPNDRKRREIFEEKNELQNTTQWDKNITNFINHEQHLPIDNKTNFVTNNITSL